MATGSISQMKLPNGSTYALKDASLYKAGVLSGDGANVVGVSENYFRPTVKVFDAAPVRTDLSVIKISAEDYAGLVAGDALLSDALYVVEGSYEDVYGQQIKNLAPGTDPADAVNLEQLAEVSSRAYDTYTKTETDQKIASAQYFKKYVVQALPSVADADERGIYLVPNSDPETQDTYDEYVVVGEGSSKAWEKIGSKSIDLSGYKTKQTAMPSPAASGSATAFIDTVSQDENGIITATKKNIQAASTSQAGIVQLNNALTSTSTTQAATANAVKLTNDKFADYSLTSHVHDQYLTAVPDAYKTYAATLSSLSSDYSLTSHTHSDYALTSHAHGNVTNDGKLTATGVALANNDALVIVDSSDSSKIKKTTITFDGSTTSQFLSKRGNWENIPVTSVNSKDGGAITLFASDIKDGTTSNNTVADDLKLYQSYTYSDWICNPATNANSGTPYYIKTENDGLAYIAFIAPESGAEQIYSIGKSIIDGQTTILWEQGEEAGVSLTATRTAMPRGYRLGPANGLNPEKILAAEDNLGYALSTATGVLSSGSYVYDVADRTMTTIGINQSTTPVVVRLPAAGNRARDFILRIEISSATAPTFTFTNTAGLDFESEDDDWAVMQPGVNLLSFTETKR